MDVLDLEQFSSTNKLAHTEDSERTAPSGPRQAGRISGGIRSMGTDVVQRICSDQVIVDLQSALKELLENALDAGTRRLDVRLKEYGVELLEVADNGSGIDAANLEGVALRHHTSKLKEFDDLQKLRSFGFRGEALNSLAALSTLGVSTRTAKDKAGTQLTFGKDGAIASRTPLARDVGTCVSVGQLFAPFPVRRRELQRNATTEFRKLLISLQAYALICDGVRFSCVNTLAKGGKQTVLQTEGGSGGMRAAIASVFGAKQLQELTPLSAKSDGIEISGFISRPRAGDGRRSGDRQYVYVNRRPVDFPKFSRTLNEVRRRSGFDPERRGGASAKSHPASLWRFVPVRQAFRAATAKAECFPVVFINLQVPPCTCTCTSTCTCADSHSPTATTRTCRCPHIVEHCRMRV